ncbi:MAG: adenylyl-sulfate kinase [Sandaracinus sp.]|nr:adenylyl-sulfate kinase [Myxococcales bacterium]MCB9622692.1 adenylyl-sulfate kinase [Sandaracinus sp.]MCB9635668.1 adenylyl-sulfate kinase [Sandaracinus sp.]
MSDAPKATNLTWHAGEIDREGRARAHGHRGATLWLTGLSGSGKSTLAHRVERLLIERGVHAYVLDGDNVRHGLCRDLGFAPEDRHENIRRVGEVAKLFSDAGVVVLTAFVSPYRADRDEVRALLAPGDFVEVHVAADLATCESRDPKGLYAKARRGEIRDFTGIDAPYEAPLEPELRVDTGAESVDASAARVVAWLEARGVIAG